MADNKKFNTYVSSNGTMLNFPAGAKPDMTEEQRVCYQNFINVLAQVLVKYASEAETKKSYNILEKLGGHCTAQFFTGKE